MTRSSKEDREDRLAVALKENLKRRKAQARVKASASGPPPARALGTAPQAGFKDRPESRPKIAPKRG